MTTTPAEQGATFRDYAAAEVRAHMGRQRLSARAMALAVGESHTWATRRVNGVVPMTTDDLERIATVLGMTPMALLTGGATPPPRDSPSPQRGAGSVTDRYPQPKRHLVVVDSLAGTGDPMHSVCAMSVTAGGAA